jgi:hypothetical protein
LRVAERRGLVRDHRRGRDRKLGIRAARRDAEHLVALAKGLRARYDDGARHIAAEHRRELDLREAAPALPVDRIDRRGAHLDQHLALAGLAALDIALLQDLRTARFVDHDRAH